ncbi:hypothetical protein NX821_003221 (plasmid) [Clostridium septicum]|uniref:hypothetical protein n=1 Tax=Clostridium septicum TaxID=1504 RepID=UPI0008346FCE|nr:hypothetical protein [Clostridium septicum]
MRILIKEVIWNFKQSFISNIILIFQLAICFWLICMLSNSFSDMGFKRYYKDFIKNDEIYYQMSFYESAFILSELSSDVRALENTKSFINDLRSQKDFTYAKYTSIQNVFVNNEEFEKRGVSKNNLNNFLSSSSGDPNVISLLSHQMDKNGFDHFEFEVYEGRSFNNEDYVLKSSSDELSIILGYNYKDILKVGEKIKFIYAGKQLEGEVVGILEKDSSIFNNNINVTSLDNELIIPLTDFEYMPENMEEQYHQAVVYVDILGGANIITSINSNNIDITRNIYNLCTMYDFMKFNPSITATTNGLNMFKGESEQAIKLIFGMIIVMAIFCIFTFIMNMYNKIEANMRRYLIQILQGASINHIIATYILEIFIVIVLSLGISGYLLRREISISYTFLLLLAVLSSIVTIITSITIAYRFKKLDSDKLLRRE